MQKLSYVFFGHHRSASTWILEILIALCNKLGFTIGNYHELSKETINSVDFIADINAEWEHRSALRRYRGFHVIRDPRDIAVSAYFSHKYSHPMGAWLEDQRRLLESVDLNAGIRASIDFRSRQFDQMSVWQYNKDPNIYETRYEIISRNSADEFERMFDFLGILPKHLNREQLTEILAQHSFEKITEGRRPGQEDIKHHYRKGMAGDWVNYFSDENKEYFKQKHGQLLIHLGYEKDTNW